jgi:thymidylate synthase ThyX
MAACGYQPIYNKVLLDYKFYEIDLQGDQTINNKIINTLKITQSNEVKFFDKLSIKSSKNIQETSKNSKGQVETYRSIFNVEVSITRDNKIIKKQNFNESFSYDNKTSKFELTQYQMEVENIIINKIINDLVLFLN